MREFGREKRRLNTIPTAIYAFDLMLVFDQRAVIGVQSAFGQFGDDVRLDLLHHLVHIREPRHVERLSDGARLLFDDIGYRNKTRAPDLAVSQ